MMRASPCGAAAARSSVICGVEFGSSSPVRNNAGQVTLRPAVRVEDVALGEGSVRSCVRLDVDGRQPRLHQSVGLRFQALVAEPARERSDRVDVAGSDLRSARPHR